MYGEKEFARQIKAANLEWITPNSYSLLSTYITCPCKESQFTARWSELSLFTLMMHSLLWIWIGRHTFQFLLWSRITNSLTSSEITLSFISSVNLRLFRGISMMWILWIDPTTGRKSRHFIMQKMNMLVLMLFNTVDSGFDSPQMQNMWSLKTTLFQKHAAGPRVNHNPQTNSSNRQMLTVTRIQATTQCARSSPWFRRRARQSIGLLMVAHKGEYISTFSMKPVADSRQILGYEGLPWFPIADNTQLRGPSRKARNEFFDPWVWIMRAIHTQLNTPFGIAKFSNIGASLFYIEYVMRVQALYKYRHLLLKDKPQ